MTRVREWLTSWGAFVFGLLVFSVCMALAVFDFKRFVPNPDPAWVLRNQVISERPTFLPDPDRTGGPPMALAIGWSLLVIGGAWWFIRKHTPRGTDRPDVRPMEYHLASWVFLLDRGAHYDRVISGIASEDLSRLASRRLAAERLAAAIQPEDIRDGFSVLPSKSRFPTRLAQDAKRLADDQAAVVARAGAPDGDACLLLFTCTDLGVETVPIDATPEHIARALRISVAGHPGEDSVMFVRHRLLDKAAGQHIVEGLRADVLARTRTV